MELRILNVKTQRGTNMKCLVFFIAALGLAIAFPAAKLEKKTVAETSQNDPFNINGGQTVSGGIGQQGENINQGGPVNNGEGYYYGKRVAETTQTVSGKIGQQGENINQYAPVNNGGKRVSDDPSVHIPITWPLGTYGLPMPKSGCPSGCFWHNGTRLHDTENTDHPRNAWSDPYDLSGKIAKNDMEQKFCMKTQTQTSKYNLPWPKGQYCIFKKGNCPGGFQKKSIFWDDEDTDNHNSYSGQLPDGKYDGIDTLIDYCCRTDGNASNAIILPTDYPFVLFKSNSPLCQQVRGMEVRSEFFYWDNQDVYPLSTIPEGGPGGDLVGTKRDIRLYYCYYFKKDVAQIGPYGKRVDETPQNDPFNINGGQTVSGQIGQQGENINQGGPVNNGNTPFYPYYQ